MGTTCPASSCLQYTTDATSHFHIRQDFQQAFWLHLACVHKHWVWRNFCHKLPLIWATGEPNVCCNCSISAVEDYVRAMAVSCGWSTTSSAWVCPPPLLSMYSHRRQCVQWLKSLTFPYLAFAGSSSSRLNFTRYSSHLATRLDGSVCLYSHIRDVWSVHNLNSRLYRYSLSVSLREPLPRVHSLSYSSFAGKGWMPGCNWSPPALLRPPSVAERRQQPHC